MKHLIFIFVLLGFFTACDDQQVKKRLHYLPDSTGSIDEIIVVTPKQYWRGEVGKKLRKKLQRDYDILPQSEPLFDLHQVAGNNLLDLLKRSSLILVMSTLDTPNATTNLINNQISQLKAAGKKEPTAFFARSNVWASPQRIVYLFGQNEAALLENIEKYEGSIIQQLKKIGDKKALTNVYIPGVNDGLSQLVQQKFKLNFDVPNKYEIAHQTNDMLWMRFDNYATESVSNIIIYTKPYDNNEAPLLSQALPIIMRDEAGQHVQSQLKNTYMIADSILPFEQQMITYAGNKGIVSKGLWRIKNDFMGGPFINFCFNDETNKRTVTIDGFVYAPKQKKRPHMRNLEALLSTVQPL
jgi:hypothetical protein